MKASAWRGAAAVLVLALPLAAGCMGIGLPGRSSGPRLPEVAGWDWNVTGHRPSLVMALGDPDTSGAGSWPAPFDTAPTAYDIDGDGMAEVVAQGNDTHVHVYSLRTGRELASLPTTIPPHWYVERVLNPVTVAVLRPGEPPTLVVADPAAYVAAWRFSPQQSGPDRFVFERQWESRMDGCHPTPGMDAGVAVADAGGGKVILVQTEETGVYALGPDGRLLWKQCIGGGNAAPAVGDLDGDGRAEAVFASDEGIVTVVDAATGTVAWRLDVTKHGIWPGSVSVTPTLAELDGAPPMEVLLTARHAWSAEPSVLPQEHMGIVAAHGAPGNATGTVLWVREPNWANPLSYTRLVVRDVDGDGRADIFGMDWNTIGHYPGNWEVLAESHVFRLDAQGQTVWTRALPSWWSNKDIAVADFDGDGQAEVLANGPRLGDDGWFRIDAATGTPEGSLSFAGWKVLRGPVLADIRHDGSHVLLVALESVDGRGAIAVVDPGSRVADQGGASP